MDPFIGNGLFRSMIVEQSIPFKYALSMEPTTAPLSGRRAQAAHNDQGTWVSG